MSLTQPLPPPSHPLPPPSHPVPPHQTYAHVLPPQLYREGIYTIVKDHFGTHTRESSQSSSRFPQLSRRSTYERRNDDPDKASNGYGHYGGSNGYNGGSNGHGAYGGENGGTRERI